MRRRETSHHTGIAKAAITAALTGAMAISGAGVFALADEGGTTFTGGGADPFNTPGPNPEIPMGDPQYPEGTVAVIGETPYQSLEAAFAAAADGDTIRVLADCSGNGIKIPQGKYSTGLTVDFGGHTYDFSGTGVGSNGTENNGFQLLKDNTITFKNGTITATSDDCGFLLQNYSNLTLDNMTIDGSNAWGGYTMSNNNGDTVIKDSHIIAPAGDIAFDVCRYSSYPKVSVTVKGNSVIDGDVEVYASGSDLKEGLSLDIQSGAINGTIVNGGGVTVDNVSDPKLTIQKDPSASAGAPEGYKWVNVDGSDTAFELVKVDPDGDGKGLLKVNAATNGNQHEEFKVYKVFNATSVDTSNYKAENLSWAGDDVKAAVMAELASYGYTGNDNPQTVAEFIKSEIDKGNNNTETTNSTITNSGNLANRLAKALVAVTPQSAVNVNQQTDLDGTGLYLLVSNPSSVSEGFVGTAPIWLPYSADATTLQEVTAKSSAIQFEKKASEGDDPADVVDAGLGETVTFTLTATLPSNYGAYSTYALKFSDTLPAGLTYVTDSGSVKLNEEGNSLVQVSSGTSGTNLTAEIANLKETAPDAKAGDKIVMTYTATVNANAEIGLPAKNVNEATLEYSNDPNSDSKGTMTSEAAVATYQLDILKVDKGTNAPLSGIRFTLMQGNKYVQSDGSLGDEEYAFTTGDDGKFTIPRIDAGTYTLDELSEGLPSGYTAITGLNVEITSSALSSERPTLSVNTGTNANVEDVTADTTSGIVSVKVSNTKEIVLPITGMTPSQLASKAGIALIVAGGALMLIYVSKNKKKSEDK